MEANKDKLYLYKCNNSYYTVGYIRRVNDKTVTMDSGHKFLKTELDDKLYELSHNEKQLYEGAVLREIIGSRHDINRFLHQINVLEKALQLSTFATINTELLQSKVNQLTALLSRTCEQCVILNDEIYKMDATHRLEKINKKNVDNILQ